MNASRTWVSVCVVVGLLAGTANAVNIDIATVPVGNAGNVGELSGEGAAGGYGPDRICGAVGYNYRIGTHEVTAWQYKEFLNKVGGVDTYGLYNTGMWSDSYGCKIERYAGSGKTGDPYQYRVADDWANRPVNFVSYWDACRFANWLHNDQPPGAQGAGTTERGAYTLDGYNGDDGRTIQRNANWKWAVTSEDEGYKAAYYNKGEETPSGELYWNYPTSSDTAPGRDMADVSGNNANYYTGCDPYPIDSPHYTTVVGEFQDSDSPYGTFDQGGNVWEWNESVVYEGTYDAYHGLRGGSFNYFGDYYLHAAYRSKDIRYDGSPMGEAYDLGFRVVEVPEPGSAALALLGALGLLGRRSSR